MNLICIDCFWLMYTVSIRKARAQTGRFALFKNPDLPLLRRRISVFLCGTFWRIVPSCLVGIPWVSEGLLVGIFPPLSHVLACSGCKSGVSDW